jgi:proteasome accessory factor B
MERVERLLNLLGALLDTERPLSRDEIAKRVPGYASDSVAFRRAFERDKETLRSMGVPLITELLDPAYPESGEGYRVPQEQYALDDPGLSRDEMDALALAASSVKLSDSATAMALLKLGGESASAQQTVALEDDERLPVLFSARSARRRVRFVYKGRERLFDPFRLSFRNGHWYVSGFDHGHDQERTYRLDRMSALTFASDGDAFAAPVSKSSPWLPSWQMGDEPLTRALLLVDADHVQLTEGHAAEQHVIDRRPDGSAVIGFDVTNRDAFMGYVIGFLDHAEILEPVDLREDFVAYLREVASA